MIYQKVTIAPPSLSEIHPPKGRIKAPTNGPRKANPAAFNSGNSVLIKRGNAAEYPINDPKHMVYSQVIIQVCLFLNIFNCSFKLCFVPGRLFIPNNAKITESMIG